MKCPECGGPLVWNHLDGYVVCGGCGLVVDRIVEYNAVREDEREVINRMLRLKGRPTFNPVLYRYRGYLKKFREAKRMVKGKYWLTVDYDRYFETGRFIHVVKHKASVEAERNVAKLGLVKLIEEGIEFVKKHDPTLLCRSTRGKLALGYMVARKLREGVYPSVDEVTKIFNISETSYRRLVEALSGLKMPQTVVARY